MRDVTLRDHGETDSDAGDTVGHGVTYIVLRQPGEDRELGGDGVRRTNF